MAITDKKPLKGLFNNEDAYALGELSDTDTISPEDIDYSSSGNAHINAPTVKGSIDQIESKFTTYDVEQVPDQIPYFQAYMSTQQSLSDWYINKIRFDTVSHDTENAFNITTYKYTIPVTGMWKLQTSLRILSKEIFENRIEFMRGNNTTILRAGGNSYHPGTTDVYGLMVSLSGVAQLTIGDEIYVAINPNASIETVESGSIYSSFGAYLHREIV